MTTTHTSAKTGTTDKAFEGFSAAERAAMKEHAKDLKAAARRGSAAEKAAEAEQAVVDKIAEMEGLDRVLAERLHAIVRASAPALAPKLWYGMPAYARDGKIVCYFKCASKFSTRYAQFGFEEAAHLDDGTVWPVVFAVTELTAADEARISELVKRAAG
jgi:uncharacterized protein YdhG (YjbR/CyaY superfamily)